MTSVRFLGPLDADEDERFRDHFVPQDLLRALVSNESNIVYGAKGGGKTALRRALTEIENASFFTTGTIDLDALSFQRVHVELAKVCEATGADIMSLARATWRNVIALFFLEIVSDRVATTNADLRERIDAVLKDERFSKAEPLNGVFSQARRFLERLGNVGLNGDAADFDAAETRRITVDRFPPTPQLERLLDDVCRVIAHSQKDCSNLHRRV
jgi:hypothetical protein